MVFFPANWGMDYATDPTFYGNQKQPLNIPTNYKLLNFYKVDLNMSTNIPIIYCLNIGFLKVGTLNVAMLWPGFYGKYKVLMLLLNVLRDSKIQQV